MLILLSFIQFCFSAESKKKEVNALLVIDVQNCFLPTGELPLLQGDKVVEPINELYDSNVFQNVVFTQDFHPDDHISFAANSGTEEFAMVSLGYDNDGNLCQRSPNPFAATYNPVECASPPPKKVDQMMWPKHCVQGTPGVDLAPGLRFDLTKDIFLKKGWHNYIDSYSAFYDNGGFKETPMDPDDASKMTLNQKLKQLKVTHVYVVGLATDYCVQSTAHDAKNLGFDTTVILDATRGKDEVHIRENILPALEKAKIHLRTVDEVITELRTGVKPPKGDDDPSKISMGGAMPKAPLLMKKDAAKNSAQENDSQAVSPNTLEKQGAQKQLLANAPGMAETKDVNPGTMDKRDPLQDNVNAQSPNVSPQSAPERPALKRSNAKEDVFAPNAKQPKTQSTEERGVSGSHKADKSSNDKLKESNPTVWPTDKKKSKKEHPQSTNKAKAVSSSSSFMSLALDNNQILIISILLFTLIAQSLRRSQKQRKNDFEMQLLICDDEI